MIRISVLIATTDGPAQVQRLAEEDPEVRSVICLNGTSQALPISAAYDAFVRKPTGVIERLFGHPVFRMDVSAQVSEGRSWQLGVFAAHILHARGELAERPEDATHVLWLTGEVNNDHEVKRVDHVAKKLERSAAMLCGLAEGGGKVILGYPKGNADEVEQVLTADPDLTNAISQAVPLKTTDDLLDRLFPQAEAVPPLAANAVEAGEKHPVPGKRRLRLAGIAAALALVLAGVFGWNVFGEISRWRAMAADGAYEKLLLDIEITKNSGCLTCRAAAQVYPVVAGWRSPGQGDLELTASEIHAPAGRSCALFRFDRIDVEERLLDVASPGRFADSSVDGLCGLLYRIRNTGSQPFHGWLSVRPQSGTQARTRTREGTKHARLAPGETLAVRVGVPEWLRREVTYGVHAIAGEGPLNDITRWAIRGAGNKPGGPRDARLAILGLTARSMVHRIRLTRK